MLEFRSLSQHKSSLYPKQLAQFPNFTIPEFLEATQERRPNKKERFSFTVVWASKRMLCLSAEIAAMARPLPRIR
jgi:hypothetical protein